MIFCDWVDCSSGLFNCGAHVCACLCMFVCVCVCMCVYVCAHVCVVCDVCMLFAK